MQAMQKQGMQSKFHSDNELHNLPWSFPVPSLDLSSMLPCICQLKYAYKG